MNGCVLDTDVVIAALDRSDAHHRNAARVIRTMIAEGVPLMLSVINYAETLVRPAADESTLRVAVGAIDSLGIKLLSPTAAIARDAARLRASNISLADGFALATARAHNAGVASFDQRVRRAAKAADIELAANR
ncbi:MAG: type II toxin-antitoxin system VapC family toxin [Solirubrobacteraceae bacterium]